MPGRGDRRRSLWAWARTLLPPPAAARPAASSDTAIFARAVPESVSIEETYRFEQEISRNRFVGRAGSPSGRITISLPYDGYEYFTRQALSDVEAHLRRRGPHEGDVDALVGHLVLANYQDTDLADVLELSGRYGVLPLRLPVRSPVLDVPVLVSDRHEYHRVLEYAPAQSRPEIIPIELSVELEDPDNAALPRINAASDPSTLDDVAGKIIEHVQFKPRLTFSLTVRLTLPPRHGRAPRAPIVRRVAVERPTIISLAPSSLRLRIDGHDADLQHNPVNRSLEWFDVRTTPGAEAGEGEPWSFHSPPMLLEVEQPGELFARQEISVEVDVEVPGQLLSGVDARLFDACGRQYRRGRGNRPTLRSTITTHCTVVLRDAFARRLLSPYLRAADQRAGHDDAVGVRARPPTDHAAAVPATRRSPLHEHVR